MVQGAGAPVQIIEALQRLDRREDIDVIILARGGGSLEDLWSFNDESVARAIHQALHPIVTGIGHETDFTIVAELLQTVMSYRRQLDREVMGYIGERRRKVAALSRTLALLSPRSYLDSSRQRLDASIERLDQRVANVLERQRARLKLQSTRLRAVSPQHTLSRGYAVVRGSDGQIVSSVHHIRSRDQIAVQVADGAFAATVAETPGQSRTGEEK